jgi:predicted rRNA methylase YqxC with S4 and FtsJ domains
MGKRERLDLLLVGRGLVGSREDGRRKIMAGDVLVNDQAVTKAGALIDASARIGLKATARYVSRGGLKLEKALRISNCRQDRSTSLPRAALPTVCSPTARPKFADRRRAASSMATA